MPNSTTSDDAEVAVIAARVDADVKRELRAAARRADRSLSAQVRLVLREWAAGRAEGSREPAVR